MPETIPAENLNLEIIKSRSVKGITSLVTRSVAIQLISALGFLLLTIFLGLNEVGVFIAVTEVIGILGYFSDIGLASALIQKKDQPTLSDLRTTFTIQQSLVSMLIFLSLGLSPLVKSYFHLTNEGINLLYALLAGFFLASLKTIPSVQLERTLKFNKLAFVEVLETIVFYTTAVVLAVLGAGIKSYTVAVLARGIVGLITLYIISPWQIGLGFSLPAIKKLLKFGIPYQANTFLAVLKDRITNLLLFRIIGSEGIAILGWAQTWSQKPLRLIMDNVTKITFPSLSRLQGRPHELKKGLEKSIFYTVSTTFPILVIFSLVASQLVLIIPRYQKWEPGLLPLYVFLFSAAWASVSTPLTTALNAIGKIKLTFYMMIMWTILTLGLTPFLAFKYGYLGAVLASFIISFTSIVPVIVIRRYIPFDLKKTLIFPTLTSLALFIILFMVTRITSGLPAVFGTLLLAGMVYPPLMIIINGESVKTDIKNFFSRLNDHRV